MINKVYDRITIYVVTKNHIFIDYNGQYVYFLVSVMAYSATKLCILAFDQQNLMFVGKENASIRIL